MKLSNPNLLRHQAYINGTWIPAKDGRTFPVLNPFNDELIAEVADLGAADTEIAIEAAAVAFKSWRAETAGRRSKILRRWFELILENIDDLALILTTEQGKPLAEAKGEIKYGASFVEWFAEEGKRAYGDVIPGHGRDKRITVIKQPVGVVAAITPWNFPVAMITRKVAPALAVGCTVVIKPAQDTPLSALALAVLAEAAGIPPGVFNVLTSNQAKRVGEVLTSSPIVRKLSFTGSTPVGKELMRQCAGTVKALSLELGGNAPFIVFEDADIEGAVAGAMASKYRNGGQTCVCANRFYVQSSVYDQFVERLAAAVEELSVGDGREAGVDVGPLINDAGLKKVRELVDDAKQKGAMVKIGGSQLKTGARCYAPTVLAGVTKDMDLLQTEIFGPVAPIVRFDTEAEVIALANDTPFGLAAYFYGRDYALIWRVAEALEYGMVGINTGMISTTVAPFGGMKESGFGREGSKYGLEDYLEIKYMCWGGVGE
ncbi:NAD-dependent succinate-semialdehyde dehydrogenase [Neolewinella persica]|uniref:NAD-dependent succinate-semialdehyde dehydrogenase n=1 Tax=Neolewinella persica TaxID=70998 RepID=UPI00035F0E51|nr:NAD-dependent succinate-semialdehyde dehydrogenase [Neolewinella persica]